MKIKLDENMPEALVAELTALEHDTDNVQLEGLAGEDDSKVREGAQAAGRFPITQDLDFSDLRRFRPGTHHGILLVRLPEAGRRALTRRIVEVFRSENVEDWQACFVVISGHKLRVVRPTES